MKGPPLSRLLLTSIRARIMRTISLLIVGIVAVQILYFPAEYKDRAIKGLSGKAVSLIKIIGHNAAPSLEFDDSEHAREVLNAASQDPDLRYIAVYREDGTVFSAWNSPHSTAPKTGTWGTETEVELDGELLVVRSPLSSKNGINAGVAAAFSTQAINEGAAANMRTTLLISILILAAALVFAQRLGNGIRIRIGHLVRMAQQMAAGTLNQQALRDDLGDEIGLLSDAFNEMLHSQRFLVQQIARTAGQIKAMSAEIVGEARQQEQGATEQSSAVEETRHTMDSLLQSGRQIAQSAQLVLQNAEKTQSNNQLIADRISALSTHTQRITEILEIIKDIANKSELLALNAALEGTKAGESGRGFSLVASQMQRLAENVMGAVRDIKGLTGDIRDATNASVLSTEDGTKLAADTTRSARQISLIIQQQQSGTEQVSRAMDDVSQIAQQTALGSKQSLKMTKELTQLSDQLDDMVSRFELDEDATVQQ